VCIKVTFNYKIKLKKPMKQFFTLLLVCFLFTTRAQTGMTFYDFSGPTILGDTISMSQYAGKKVMVLNVASFCVFTPQYSQLDVLDSLYSKYNFAIVGYPSNDFNHQGGTDSQIISTCHSYDVHFQIMETVAVVTSDTAPLFKWLQRKDLNGVSDAHIDWNFNKFLIDRHGNWVRHYSSVVSPLDTSIINWIVEDSASLNNTGIEPVTDNNLVSLRSSNPGNGAVEMVINSAATEQLSIQMFSVDGRLVGTLYNGAASNGQTINYPVDALASGTYLIRVKAGSGVQTIKYMLQR
jgi:glutathione peroxidase